MIPRWRRRAFRNLHATRPRTPHKMTSRSKWLPLNLIIVTFRPPCSQPSYRRPTRRIKFATGPRSLSIPRRGGRSRRSWPWHCASSRSTCSHSNCQREVDNSRKSTTQSKWRSMGGHLKGKPIHWHCRPTPWIIEKSHGRRRQLVYATKPRTPGNTPVLRIFARAVAPCIVPVSMLIVPPVGQ